MTRSVTRAGRGTATNCLALPIGPALGPDHRRRRIHRTNLAERLLADGNELLAKAVGWYRENGVGETYTHLKPEELKASGEKQ